MVVLLARLLPLLLLVPALSGCFGGDEAPDVPEPGAIDVTSTTGGVRGVIVDQGIRPIKGATVQVVGAETKSTTTDAGGLFVVTGLAPGDYAVRASHPLYDSAQQTATVEAGVAEPPALRIQLVQVVFEKPYVQTMQYKGFIVCSIGTSFAASEECGEGVGVECVQDPVPCGRVGGQGNNEVQYDFYVANSNVRTILVEQVWEPNAEATGELYTVVATGWSCDPTCGGDELNTSVGPSPLVVRVELDGKKVDDLNITSATRFSAFTWPNWGRGGDDPAQANVAVNQAYELFVTVSYVLPLPPEWSLIGGSKDPFAP